MKIHSIAMVLLFVLQSVGATNSFPQSSSAPKFREEITKQKNIYETDDDNLLESYVVDRSLSSYVLSLHHGFDQALADLGGDDRWLDIGAGMGRAILDYYNQNYELKYPNLRIKSGKKARTVAISIEDRRSVVWQLKTVDLAPNQMRYLAKKRLGEYSLDELGQFQLITDVFGGFSYTENLARFMEKALSFLALDGVFFTLLQDVGSEDGANQPFYKGSPFLTEINSPNNSEMKVCSWLKRINCVEVSCELKRWEPPVEVYRIRKICDKVSVPAVELVHFEAGTPPQRRFRLTN